MIGWRRWRLLDRWDQRWGWVIEWDWSNRPQLSFSAFWYDDSAYIVGLSWGYPGGDPVWLVDVRIPVGARLLALHDGFVAVRQHGPLGAAGRVLSALIREGGG